MQDSVLSIFAKRIRDIRADADQNQQDVARALHVSYKTYGRYERGETEPQVKFIADFCRHFGVSADYLLGLSDSRPEPATLSARFKRSPLDDLTDEQMEEVEFFAKVIRERDARKKNRTAGA